MFITNSQKQKKIQKKYTWLIEYEYGNTTGKDIYYQANPKKDYGLFGSGENVMVGYFALVSIKNTKALSLSTFDDVNISGDKTWLQSDKGEPIFIVKKGKTYTKTMDYRNDKVIEPLITIMIENNITFIDNILELL